MCVICRTNLDAALQQLGIDTPQYETENTLKGSRSTARAKQKGGALAPPIFL
jgi:hypothetical protein